MKRCLLLALVLLVFLPGFSQETARQLDSLFSALHQKGRFYGNVLVAEKGIPVYTGSFGLANEKTGQQLTPNSVFELASVSKQFTAMGIVLLKERGKLRYEDELQRFFPQLPYKGVTVRNLLQHTSGLPDYMELFEQYWDKKKIAQNKDVIALLAARKPALLFTPGSKWEYSNTGYALLASIIEKVSGLSYGAFLKKNIFEPVGMQRTAVYNRRLKPVAEPDYALGYVYSDSLKRYVLPDELPAFSMVYYLDGIVGDGTVNSTLNDLLKWDRALYTDRLVPAAARREIFTPALVNGKDTHYGFGWAINTNKDYGTIYQHSGGWPGYSTFIERQADNDKTIIVLQNHERSKADLTAVRRILYHQPLMVPEKKEITVPESVLSQYVGTYQLAPEFSITVTLEGGGLKVQATDQPKFSIFAKSETRFFLKVVEADVEFVREGGKVTKLVLYQNGQEMEGEKVK